MDFNLVERRERDVVLRALDEHAWHTEAKLPIESVARATGEDAGSGGQRLAGRRPQPDLIGACLEPRHTHARPHRRSGGDRLCGKRRVEPLAVHDRRPDLVALDGDRVAIGGMKPR